MIVTGLTEHYTMGADGRDRGAAGFGLDAIL